MSEMNDYIITCTSGIDIDRSLLNNNVKCINYKFLMNDVEYDDDYYASYDEHKFYQDLIDGAVIKTSQIGYGRYLDFFEEYLKQGKSVLHVGLSSGITGDTSVAMAVARELNEKYQNNKVYVVDSTCASSGYGMFVLMVSRKADEGLSFKELIDYAEEAKCTIHHWFISSDLTFYVRGGRISSVEGFFGKALKICPLLCVNHEGKLIPIEKIRTKNRAIEGQFEKMQEYCIDGDDYSEDVFICNSICEEDANVLGDMIKEHYKNVKNVYITSIGPSIGAHTGPDTISLFFIGKNRNEILKED